MLQVNGNDVVDKVADVFLAGAEPILLRVPPKVARITAQQGLFSLHPDPTAVWAPAGPRIFWDRFDVPLTAKAFFREALHAFGFNRERLMTDLDGLCATLAWEYRNRT